MSTPVALLLLGAAWLYIASRAAVDALARRGSPGGASGDDGSRAGYDAGRLPSAGRLALGHWMPIVAAAGLATAHGLSHIALGIVFGSSVASLLLAMGLTTYLTPPANLPASRRAWPLLLTGAMVPLLAGFTGQLTALHALMMLLLGAVAWSVWTSPAPVHAPDAPGAGGTPGGVAPAQARPGDVLQYESPPSAPSAPRVLPSAPQRMPTLLMSVQWLLAVSLALLGAKAALRGIVDAEAGYRLLPATLLAAAVLSPLLVLPILASGTDLAHHGRSGDAASALIALAMLNLFALLPMVILFWYVRSAAYAPLGLWRAWAHAEPIKLPPEIWRIDVVTLTLIGFAIIPVALGRWAIGRLESVGLIVGYAAYLAASVLQARM